MTHADRNARTSRRRFLRGAYAATTVTAMGDRSGFEWSDPPKFNPIDQFVADKWQRMKIEPSQVCTDLEFVRRVYLDLTGLPPTAEQVKAFTTDVRHSQVKRDALIDSLIGSPEFIEFCRDESNRPHAQQMFNRWFAIAVPSFGRPGSLGDGRAVELGLRSRTSGEMLEVFLEAMREFTTRVGLELPEADQFGLELSENGPKA